MKRFSGWCQSNQAQSFPVTPELLAFYLSMLASTGVSLSTVKKARAAIDQVHAAHGMDPPGQDRRVKLVLRGIVRKLGVAPKRTKAPLLVEQIRRVVASLPSDLKGKRDRALILVGFAGAFRRSELVGIQVHDVRFEDEGMKVKVGRSKTDQEGRGAVIGIPYGRSRHTCPVRAMEEWLQGVGISEGPVFRAVDRHGRVGTGPLTPRVVAAVVKTAVEEIGLDPELFGGHSLRAGLVTEAARAGVEERVIAQQTRHRSITVLRGYIRDASVFRENAAACLGL